MADKIKGITIEFRGDTTNLDKALRQVRNDTKNIDSELRKVNNALKFNPRNVELLKQKQELLKQKVDATRKSLDDLKKAQAQMDANGVDKNSAEYRELQREIITTESKLKTFTAQEQKAAAEASKLGRIGSVMQDAGSKIEKAGNALRRFSQVSAGVAASIGAISYKAGVMADDLNTLSKVTGIDTKDLQMYAASADLVDVSVDTMAKTHQKLKKNMLGAQDGTNEQAQYFEQLGINITNADGSLRDANAVFDETIAALGKMENETERDAIAMAIFGKSATELNPLIEDGGRTYEKVAGIMSKYGLEPVSQEELDKANEFNDAIDTIKLVFNQAVQIIGTKIAGYLVPAMEKVVGLAASIAEKIAGLSGGALAKLGGLSAIGAALSPALIIIGKLTTSLGEAVSKVALLVQKVPGLSKAFGFLKANPIVAVVAALAGLGLAIGKSGKSADELVAMFDGVVKKIEKKIPQIIKKVAPIVKRIASAVAKNAPVMLQGVLTLIQAILAALPKYIPKVLQAAVSLFTSIVQAIPVVLPKLLAGITSLIGSVLKALPGFAASLLSAAVSLFMSIVKAIPQVVVSLVAALPQIGKAMISYFKGLLASIKSIFANIGTWFGQKFAAAWKAIKEKFSGWGTFWGGLWEKVKKKFADIGAKISASISGTVKGGINRLMSSLEEKLNHVVVTINKVIQWINDHTPVNLGFLSAVQLPRLAKGGVLNGAQAVIAGEAGPEAIIPLDKLFAQMDRMAETIKGTGSGEGITINVYATPGMDVNALAETIQQKIITAQKRRTQAWA